MVDEILEDGIDLDEAAVREDFEHIWSKNLVKVTLIKNTDSQAGDYFRETNLTKPVTKEIYLNLQGKNALKYSRQEFGISTVGQTFHAYAKYDENIENKDIILWNGKRFIVENHDVGMYKGQYIFQECDIKRVDKE